MWRWIYKGWLDSCLSDFEDGRRKLALETLFFFPLHFLSTSFFTSATFSGFHEILREDIRCEFPQFHFWGEGGKVLQLKRICFFQALLNKSPSMQNFREIMNPIYFPMNLMEKFKKPI